MITGLAWMCLPDLEAYRNGIIMVVLACCIVMVLIWNDLAQGDTELCAVLVAINSILQIVLYTPYTLFFLNVISKTSVYVGFWPVAQSVLIFLGIPLVIGVILRYSVWYVASKSWLENKFIVAISPMSLVALIYTIVILFASQGNNIFNQIGNVARVSVPLLLYFIIMFSMSVGIGWWMKMDYATTITQAFTASGNNFELAIAIAVGTFGVNSAEALAATIGPLIEVPVLLGLVYVSLWMKKKYY